METFKKRLKENYHLTNYQVAQIFFLFKTLGSELSKMILMGILFHSKFSLYLFALFIMVFLRSSMGGLHFYTYVSCLAASVFFLWLPLYPLSYITVGLPLRLLTLFVCILICNIIGPIISKYRPDVCKELFPRCKKFVTIFIIFYAALMYIIPENQYLTVGYWVIILNSLQLIVAKIRKKGEQNNAC